MSSKKASGKNEKSASASASTVASNSAASQSSSQQQQKISAANEPTSPPGTGKDGPADMDDDDFDEVDEAEFKALASELEQIDSPLASASNSPVPHDNDGQKHHMNAPSISSTLANSAASPSSSTDALTPILSPSTLISPLDIEQALQYFLGRNLSEEESQGLKSLLVAQGKEGGLTVEVLQDALQIVKDEREAEEAEGESAAATDDQPAPQLSQAKAPSLVRQPSSVDPLAALKRAMRVESQPPAALTIATANSSGHSSSATTPTYAQFLRSPSSIHRGSGLAATYSTDASDVQGPSGSISRLIHDSHYAAASSPSTPTHSRSTNSSVSVSPLHRRDTSIDRINLANFSPNHNATRINSLYAPHHAHSQSVSINPSTIASGSSTELGGVIQQLQKENARLLHAYSLLKKVNNQNESKLRESMEEIVRAKEEKTANENSLVDVQIEFEAERKSHAKLQEKHSTLSTAHEALLKSQDTLSKKVDKLQQKNEIAAGAKNRYESLIETAHKNEIQLADKMRMEVDAEKERKYKALAQQMEAVKLQLEQSTQAFESLQTEHEALIASLQEEAGGLGSGRKNSGADRAFNFYSSPEFQRIRSRSKGNSIDFVTSPNPSSSASGGNQAVLFSYLQSMQMKGATPRNNEHLSLAEEGDEADTSNDGKENEKESLGSELAEIGEQMPERTFAEMAIQTDEPPARDELQTQTEAASTTAMQTQTDAAASRSAATETEPLPRKVEQSTSVELQVASTNTQTEENKPNVKDSATDMSTSTAHQETQTAAKQSSDASSQSKAEASTATTSTDASTVSKAEYETLQASLSTLRSSFDALQVSSKSDIARAEKETVAAIVSWKHAESRVKTLTVELDDTQKLLEESNMARSMYEQRVVSMEEAFFVQQQQQMSQIMTLQQQQVEVNANAAPILPISPLLPGGPNTSGGSSGSSSDASVIRIGFDRPNIAGKSTKDSSSKAPKDTPIHPVAVVTPAPAAAVQQSTIGIQTDDLPAEKDSKSSTEIASPIDAAVSPVPTASSEKQKHPIIRSKVKVDWPTESKSTPGDNNVSASSQENGVPPRGKDNASPVPKRRPMQRATTLDAATMFSDINGLIVAPSNLRAAPLGSPTNHRTSTSVDSSNLPTSMLVSLNALTQVEAYELGYERGVTDSSSVLLGKEKARREAEEKNTILVKKTGKKVPSVRILTPKIEVGDSSINSAGSSAGSKLAVTPNNAQTPKHVLGAIPIKGSSEASSAANSANPSSNNSKAASPMKVLSADVEVESKTSVRKGGYTIPAPVVDASTSPPPVIPRPVLEVSNHVVQMQIEPTTVESAEQRKLSAALATMEVQLREVEKEAASLQADKASALADVKSAEAQALRALQSAQQAQDELQAERVALKAAQQLTEEIRAQLFQAQHDAALAAATLATTPPTSTTPAPPSTAVADALEEKTQPPVATAPKKGKKGKKLSSQIEPSAAAVAPVAIESPVVEEASPAPVSAPTPTKSKKSKQSSQQLASEAAAAAAAEVVAEATPEPAAEEPAAAPTTGGGKKKKKRGGSKQSLDLSSPTAGSSTSSSSSNRPAPAVSQKLAAELRAIAAAPVSAQEIAAAQRHTLNPSFHPVQCSIL